MRILLIDDDEPLMETLMDSLIKQRYAVDIAIDGETAQDFVNLFSYDLIVLDMALPDNDGITLCQQFRQQGINVPILMLTAKDEAKDKVMALDAGADDYVVKPFDFAVLCARIRALLRREGHSATANITWGELCLNPESFEVCYGPHPMHTTPKEYALLELFLRHPSRVFSLDAIIANLWSFEDPPSGDAVRTHIKGLRQKLKAGGAPKDFIETVYGMGYRLKPLKSDASAFPSSSPASTSQAIATSNPQGSSHRTTVEPNTPNNEYGVEATPSRAEIAAAVSRAWAKHQGTMNERLRVLEATAVAIENGHLDQDLQEAGRSQAHKLAGSLGCFGFAEGSRLARELEHLLTLEASAGEDTSSLQASQRSTRVSSLVRDLRHNLDEESNHPGQLNPSSVNEGTSEPPPSSHAYTPHIVIIDADPAFVQSCTTQAQTLGMQCNAIDSATLHPDLDGDHLVTLLNQQSPDVVILWLDGKNNKRPHQQTFEQGVKHLDPIIQAIQSAHIQSMTMPVPDGKDVPDTSDGREANAVPLLLVTDITDFRQRLQLVKHGIDRLLPPTISPQELLNQVQQIIRDTHTDFKVVMVDDDDQVLDLAQTLVAPWGVQLTTVNHSTKLWDVLELVQPHMVVLDVEMPDANGLDLCQVIRADARWRSLPIVFLTIHEDISTQQQAFNLGADDFIHKSRMATELPQRILNRLRRSSVLAL